MGHIEEGTLLWEPSESWKRQANIHQYMNWLKAHKDKHVETYQSLWEWSVTDLEGFWESLWDYFDIQADEPYQTVLTSHEMPGARWFEGATINYTEHIFKDR
ncbi:MAG TPA: acetyl-coenzyme A synthetase N-terminal domain-containing protein, partial [Bacillota bacterium]|nr:acetyl-coenzyme A synthetase N-terminal domain-containing protein [Bacillota bacterium]